MWSAEARDSSGKPGAGFYTTDKLIFAGLVSNPCSSDVSFKTNVSCLVDSWALMGSTVATNQPQACNQVITTHTVPAKGTLEETTKWGSVKADKYTLDVVFTYSKQTASTAFQVK